MHNDREEMMNAAKAMLKLDLDTNGYAANAPYTIKGRDSIRYRAKVNRNNAGKYKIMLIRPEAVVDSEEV